MLKNDLKCNSDRLSASVKPTPRLESLSEKVTPCELWFGPVNRSERGEA